MNTDNREMVERFCERLADRLDFAPSYLTEKVEYALRWSETALAEASQLSGVVGERDRLREALIYAAETTNDKHTARKLFAALSDKTGGQS